MRHPPDGPIYRAQLGWRPGSGNLRYATAAVRGRPREESDLTAVLLLYAITLFAGATLLFMMQPMVGKMILPLLGGTPAVWSTCMVFFQAALLAGYAYAHATTRWLGVRRQAALHLAVMALPLITLPLGIR